MLGLMILLNAACIAWNIYFELYWLVPINAAVILYMLSVRY